MIKFTGERLIPNMPELKFLFQEHITRYIFASQFVKSKVVLDVACGTGYGADLLVQKGAKQVTGIDISKEAIEYCNANYKKNNLEFKIDDCTDMHLVDDTFDIVTSFETIEHVKNTDLFLSEVKRVIKKNGLFIVSTPNKMTYLENNQFHVKEYTKSEFHDMLKKYFSHVVILNQSYPPVIGIYKQGMGDKISEISIPDDNSTLNDEAQYFVAICSDKTFSYKNKLFLFNEKTILQFEYHLLKRKLDNLEMAIKSKNIEIQTLQLENKRSERSREPILHDYNEQIDKLKDLLNESNIKLDNVYQSFTRSTLRTRAEENLDKTYRQILGRSPDKLALQYYLPRLLNSEMSEKDLEKLLEESDEYKALRKNFTKSDPV